MLCSSGIFCPPFTPNKKDKQQFKLTFEGLRQLSLHLAVFTETRWIDLMVFHCQEAARPETPAVLKMEVAE